MYLAIGVWLEGEWRWATEPTTNQRMVTMQMEGPFADIDEECARVFAGSTLACLRYALKLQNGGMTNASLSFKQIGDGLVFTPKSVRDLEMEYGGGDRDKEYIYISPASVREMIPWIRMMTRVNKGKIGGADDGLSKYKAKVQTSPVS